MKIEKEKKCPITEALVLERKHQNIQGKLFWDSLQVLCRGVAGLGDV